MSDTSGTFDMPDTFDSSKMLQTFVICPKHGEHPHSIVSTIPGHEGVWCQICWLESLGDPLPSVQKPFKFEFNDVSTIN